MTTIQETQECAPCRNVLFVLTSHESLGDSGKKTGFHLAEVTHAWRALRETGHTVDFASIAGGAPPIDAEDRGDPINADFLDQQDSNTAIRNTKKISDVDPHQYCGVYFAGGHGAMWDFSGNENVRHIIRDIYERGGVVAAICHGVAALLDVQMTDGRYLLKHKRVTAFTNAEEAEVGTEKIVPFSLEDRIEREGAEFVGGENFAATVIVEGQLITGQNPASARGVAEEMIAYLDKAHAQYSQEAGPHKKAS